jgi:hypothetical protein
MCAFAAGSWDLNLKKEARMRKALLALPIIAAAGFAAPAMAHDGYWNGPHGYPPAGSIAVGGVAGVGALATVDAVFNPCAGFHALFDESHGQCVNGQYVGPRGQRVAYETGPAVAPPVVEYRHVRRHHRHHYRR